MWLAGGSKCFINNVIQAFQFRECFIIGGPKWINDRFNHFVRSFLEINIKSKAIESECQSLGGSLEVGKEEKETIRDDFVITQTIFLFLCVQKQLE